MSEQDASVTAGGGPLGAAQPRLSPADLGYVREDAEDGRGTDGAAASRGTMTTSEALYWLERRAYVQGYEKTNRNTNRWTKRDVAAVEAVLAWVDSIEPGGDE